MKRFILAEFAVLAIWSGFAAVPALAQNIYPYQQPAYRPGWTTPLSPYLNLLLSGSPAVNYYALVEPQFQRRQYYNQMNQTVQGLINQIPPPPDIVSEQDFNAPMPGSGHPTAFNYTGNFFMTLTGQPVPSLGAGTQRGMGAGGMMGAGRRPALMGSQGMGSMFQYMRPGIGTGAAGNMRPGGMFR